MRYYFDIIDQNGRNTDTEGVRLDTFEDMRAQARRTLAQIAADEPCSGEKMLIALHVRDEQGRDVYCLSLEISEKDWCNNQNAALM